MKKPLKKFLKSNAVKVILAWLIHKYSLLAFHTSHISFPEKQKYDDMIASDKPVIFAFWHGRLCFMPFFAPKTSHALISRHGDGALIAKVMDFFRLKQVRGSTNRPSTDKKGAKNRGGREALRECVKLLHSGKYIAVTPDGPRGPRFKAQPGVIQIARMSGIPILPASFSSSRCKIFNSWDKFLLPIPFGKAHITIGETLHIPEDIDDEELEKYRMELENRLNEITHKVDSLASLSPIVYNDRS